jgi:hypothetical protein
MKAVVVNALPAKDGPPKASGRTLTFSDGYKMAMREGRACKLTT